jgi:hypothetical protein
MRLQYDYPFMARSGVSASRCIYAQMVLKRPPTIVRILMRIEDALEGVNKHCDPAMAELMERSRTGNILCSRFNNELRVSLEMWEDPRK